MKKENKESIEFTEGQFLALAKAVYLGNWMANAQRTGREDDSNYKEYEDIADYIYSFAKDFDFPDDFESGLEFSDGEEESTEVSRLHEEYDEQNFWEILPDIFGERDFFRKYTEEEIKKMSQEEYFLKRMDCNILWEEEMEKYGVERLEIKEKQKGA